jgi:hypothetical protein
VVLAEPDAVLATKSWASLEDGTPLVTGEHRGRARRQPVPAVGASTCAGRNLGRRPATFAGNAAAGRYVYCHPPSPAPALFVSEATSKRDRGATIA